MILESDIDGFWGDASFLKNPAYLIATYFFETDIAPRLAAAQLCSEASTAQWKRSFSKNLNEDFRPRFAARVVNLKILPGSSNPGLVSCEARIAFPTANFGSSIPLMLSSLVGEGAFYCPGLHLVRLLDIDFPEPFLKTFEGPQFGVEGLRSSLNVHDRPFFVGVVKPNLGLPPEDFAELAYQSWMGGLDIAKDDEMLGDVEWSPLARRMQLCAEKRAQAEKKTGTPKMMIANITSEVAEMGALYATAVQAGANAVMVNPFFSGFSSVRLVRQMSQVPLMTHFTGMALYDRIPHFGIDGVVSVKLQRLAGADIIGLPGFGERMKNTDETVQKNIAACLAPMGKIKPALPIPGGSDSAETLGAVCQKVGHADFGFISGRGVFGHPGGPMAGAQSLHQAWDKYRMSHPVA